MPEYKRLNWIENLKESPIGKNSGKTPWNKSLSKETDDRVNKSAKKLSITNSKKYKRIKEENPDFFKVWRNNVSKSMIDSNSYGKSKIEDDLFSTLCKEYGEENVVRQYKDERYPFDCDFYIKTEDKFIELNAHWTHGGLPFDENDSDCVNKLNVWKEKAKNSKFYKQAIYVWTDLDVRKRKIAKENNLNYIIIY